jgi:ribosome maturation factor RimP
MAHFLFPVVNMRQDPYKLKQLLSVVVESMGYELVGVEFHPHSANALLRVYIDKESGISVDDCQRVSHQISGVLDVEDPIPEHYTLEVSSPGLDRPLFDVEHFTRFMGHEVRIQLAMPQNGRRNFIGCLLGMRGDDVVLSVDGEELLIPLERIKQARLIPEL